MVCIGIGIHILLYSLSRTDTEVITTKKYLRVTLFVYTVQAIKTYDKKDKIVVKISRCFKILEDETEKLSVLVHFGSKVLR